MKKRYFSIIASANILGCVFLVAGCATPTTITTANRPARFQEAAQLREVIVVPFSGQGGEAFTTLFRRMLVSSQDEAGQAHIQVKDYPQSVGGSRQVDLRSIGRSAGVQGVYTGEVTYYGVQRQPYSVERTQCTLSGGKTKKFLGMKYAKCTSTQEYTVSCEKLTANVTVVLRLVSVATGKTVYSKVRSGTAENSHCQDETDTTSDGELLGSTLQDVLAQIQADVVTVHTEEIKVSWKDSTDGLSDAQAERFKGALAFAKQGDPDDACRRFKDLRSEGVDTISLRFNLVICDEVANNLLEAKGQLVKINSDLSNLYPDTQVIEAIDRIDKKIAEIEPLKTQTQSSSFQNRLTEFPWPPPKASATFVIPHDIIRGLNNEKLTINDVDRKFQSAFDNCGYVEKRYYDIPGGFVIVTRLEQINSDGTPKQSPDRWSVEIPPMRGFNLGEYIKALFTQRSGYYRVIVFVFTPYPFKQTDVELKHGKAQEWLAEGPNILPKSIGQENYSQEYNCTALIYEFTKREREEPKLELPGHLSGRDHLEKAKILLTLKQSP